MPVLRKRLNPVKTPPIFLEPPEFRVGLRPIALADWLRVGADPAVLERKVELLLESSLGAR